MIAIRGMLGINAISRHQFLMMPERAIDNGLDPILIGIIGVILILFISIILAIVVLVRRRRKKVETPSDEMLDVAQRLADSTNGIEEEQRVQEALRAARAAQHASASPRSKILAEMGARQLLDQVNSHMLNGSGEITSRSGEIRIEWTDLEDASVQRLIMIRVQDSSTLLINGQPFPTTREGAQQGLISCLKGMKLE
jgi:hypothetical protein